MDLYSLIRSIPISTNCFTQKCDFLQNHSKISVWLFFITPEQPLFLYSPNTFYVLCCLLFSSMIAAVEIWQAATTRSFPSSNIKDCNNTIFSCLSPFSNGLIISKNCRKNIFVNTTVFTILQIQIVSFKSRIRLIL